MTYHIRASEYTCKNCGTIFIAYAKDLGCPNCEHPEQSNGEAYDFIENVLRSMYIHRRQYGRYRPPAWYQDCYADYLQSVCFNAFDFAEKYPDKGIEFILNRYRSADPKNEIADNKFIRRVLVQVRLKYHLIQKWTIDYKNRSWLEKIRQKFRSFLP